MGEAESDRLGFPVSDHSLLLVVPLLVVRTFLASVLVAPDASVSPSVLSLDCWRCEILLGKQQVVDVPDGSDFCSSFCMFLWVTPIFAKQ